MPSRGVVVVASLHGVAVEIFLSLLSKLVDVLTLVLGRHDNRFEVEVVDRCFDGFGKRKRGGSAIGYRRGCLSEVMRRIWQLLAGVEVLIPFFLRLDDVIVMMMSEA